MAKRYWFKRRRYGYGWTPATAEGRATVATFLAVVLGGAAVLAATRSEDAGAVLAYLACVGVALVVFLLVTVRHAPPARWRWGRSPDDAPDADV